MKSIYLKTLLILLVWHISYNPVVALQAKNAEVIEVSTESDLLYWANHSGDGDIIQLDGDIAMNRSLVFSCWGQDIVLDLHGHNLRIETTRENALALKGWSGSLTITDSVSGGLLWAECIYNGHSQEYHEDYAGIRVQNTDQTLIIDGADVYAKGGNFGAGIGGHRDETGNIVVQKGTVTAEGGMFAAGIGGGYQKRAGNITISGGIVVANGGLGAAGIGSGSMDSKSRSLSSYQDNVTITSGNITAQGGANGAGIGGGAGQYIRSISIVDGKVTAIGGTGGAGIGSGNMSAGMNTENDGDILHYGTIEIHGGKIEATGGYYGAGIGMGEGKTDYSTEKVLKGRNILIYGGSINAKGGIGGAGIGGGAFLSAGLVEIGKEGSVFLTIQANGGDEGAGIGGGKAGLAGEEIAIYSGQVKAAGGMFGAGIGSGGFSENFVEPTEMSLQELKNIYLLGGEMEIIGGYNAAAIGGGLRGSGANVTISKSPVVQAVSPYTYAIGAGKYSVSHGQLTVDGGNLKTSGQLGAPPLDPTGENLYPIEVAVYYDDGVTPVPFAEIEGITRNRQSFYSLTDEKGKAVVYWPKNTKMEVAAKYGDLHVLENYTVNEDSNAFAMLFRGFSPLFVVEKEWDYYLDSYPNTLALFQNPPETSHFNLVESTIPLDIDKATGTLIIPPQTQPGDYEAVVQAFNHDILMSEEKIILHVKNPLKELTVSNDLIVTGINEKQLIEIYPYPNDAEIYHLSYEIFGPDGFRMEPMENELADCIIYRFSAPIPGDYAVHFSAKDMAGCEAAKIIHITVENEDWDQESVQTGYQYTPVAFTEQEDNQGIPAILAWSSERINEYQANVYLSTSGQGLYFYKLVKDNQSKDIAFQEGFQLKNGENKIPIDGLQPQTAYEYHIYVENSLKECSNTAVIPIPLLQTNDIIPPVLTLGSVQRQSHDKAVISYRSDESGTYAYAIDENREGEPNENLYYHTDNETIEGINSITITGLLPGEWDVYLKVTDAAGNESLPMVIPVPAYQDEESDLPEVYGGWSLRESESQARIGFHTNTAGFYYVGLVYHNGPMPYIDYYGDGDNAILGMNETQIEDLPDERAYDCYILLKDGLSGQISNWLKVEIPPYQKVSTEPLSVTIEDIVRTGSGSAQVRFSTNKAGMYAYQIASDEGKPNNPAGFEEREKIAYDEGLNQLLINGLKDASGYEINLFFENGDTPLVFSEKIPSFNGGIVLDKLDTSRKTLNHGQVAFTSNKAGYYMYTAVPGEEAYAPEEMTKKIPLVEGANFLDIDDLFQSKGYTVYIQGIESTGEKSNLLTMPLDEFTGQNTIQSDEENEFFMNNTKELELSIQNYRNWKQNE